APAANSISVAPGVRLTMRSGGSRTLTWRPESSDTVCAADAGPTPSPRHSLSARTANDLMAIDKRPTGVQMTGRHGPQFPAPARETRGKAQGLQAATALPMLSPLTLSSTRAT